MKLAQAGDTMLGRKIAERLAGAPPTAWIGQTSSDPIRAGR